MIAVCILVFYNHRVKAFFIYKKKHMVAFTRASYNGCLFDVVCRIRFSQTFLCPLIPKLRICVKTVLKLSHKFKLLINTTFVQFSTQYTVSGFLLIFFKPLSPFNIQISKLFYLEVAFEKPKQKYLMFIFFSSSKYYWSAVKKTNLKNTSFNTFAHQIQLQS